MPANPLHREAVPETPNRLGIDGIEFIEYATSRPQALGQVLENMGFRPVARHRSREVTASKSRKFRSRSKRSSRTRRLPVRSREGASSGRSSSSARFPRPPGRQRVKQFLG